MLEYKLISEYYGNTRAERNNVPLINHIDEGLKILNYIQGSELSKKAFCLHPLLQGDDMIKQNLFEPMFRQVDPVVLMVTMEYRNIANGYLSDRKITALSDIKLSPIRDVNMMLVADKVQNFKDFELYHKGTHPRTVELTEYFNNWMRKLSIDYDHLKKLIL